VSALSRRSSRPRAIFPHEVIFTAALLMSAVMACLLLNLGKTQPGKAAKVSHSVQSAGKNQVSNSSSSVLGSAFLNLDQLARANSIDESDNARWSLVRGTQTEGEIYSPESGVDWQALRRVSASGSYQLPAGNTWSFNETFGGGPGYKMASGVLAGGHCALATVFRAAVIQAGLPNQANPHRWPIPGFPLNETVNIWWGTDDLLVHNTTGQDVSLDWELSPQGIKISILSFNVD
jgi:hypothetical protein